MSALINVIERGYLDPNGLKIIEGKTVSIPRLIYSDGANVTYGVDVDIGREDVINENGDRGNLPLYAVPIASGNRSLMYASVGTPVMLGATALGQWQVIGFAKTYPGTITVIPVTLSEYCLTVPTENPPGQPTLHTPVIGTPITYSTVTRKLTYAELADYGGYGTVCYGAQVKFVNGVFDSIICG